MEVDSATAVARSSTNYKPLEVKRVPVTGKPASTLSAIALADSKYWSKFKVPLLSLLCHQSSIMNICDLSLLSICFSLFPPSDMS